jgi:PAS domain S-box-containing protein
MPGRPKQKWAILQSLLPLVIGIALTIGMMMTVPRLGRDSMANNEIVAQRREIVSLTFAHRNMITAALNMTSMTKETVYRTAFLDAVASFQAETDAALNDAKLVALLPDRGAKLRLAKENLDQLVLGASTMDQNTVMASLGSILSNYSVEVMIQSDVAFAKSEAEVAQMVRVIILTSGALLTISLVTVASMFRRGKDLFDQSSLLKKTVAELAEAQRLARLGTLYWDFRKDEVHWSDQLAEIFGIPPGGSMTGSAFNALVKSDDADRVMETEKTALARSAKTGRPEIREISYTMCRPDGREVDLWARSELMATADGQPAYMLSTARDITAEEVTRRNLAESERSLALAQRISRLGHFRNLIKEDKIWWSDEMFDILGYPRSGGMIAVRDMIFDGDRKAVAVTLQQLHEPAQPLTERTTTLTFRMRHQSGDLHHFRCAAAMSYGPSGEAEELTGTLIDITDQVLQEEKLHAAVEEARRANAAKSDFLAVMSHELRTPLNGVIGMLAGLETTALDADQREQVQIARSSANVLLEILNDILDMSKIEAGKLEVEIAPFSTRDLVRSISQLFAFRIAEKGLQIEIRIDDHVPDWVEADASRIRQILSNLVSNAIKFTERGSITLTAQVQPIETRDDSALLVFSIADTGIGIPLEKQKYVFERFNQLDPSYNRRFGGTGLGLSICQSLTKIMGGNIFFHSIPSYGSTFSISLPVGLRQLPVKQAAEDPALVLIHKRILVVDDNTTNQVVARQMLKQLGQTVDIASDGLAALDAVGKQDYDLIFMDISMPHMDGYEALRCIRAMGGRFVDLPIVALTSHAGQTEMAACKAAGFDAVLTKPVILDKLRAILEQNNAAAIATFVERPAPTLAEPETVDPDFESRLAELADSGGDAFVATLLDAGLTDIARYQDVIGQFMTDKPIDRVELKRTFHSIVGLARTIGCKALAQSALELDKASATILPHANNIKDMKGALNKLTRDIKTVQDRLRRTQV